MIAFEPGGEQKEAFGSDREELSVVRRGVGAQKSFAAGSQVVLQSRKLGGHDLPPAARLLAIAQDRSAIGVAIQEIQLMGKFMDDEIAPRRPVAHFGEDRAPGKIDCAVVHGLSEKDRSAPVLVLR